MVQLPKPTISRLANGMRYMYVHMPHSNFVYTSLLGTAGRRAEHWDEIGSAHFLEHLFFGGTERFPSPVLLNDRVDELGVRRGGSTSPEYVSYWSRALPEHLEIAADFVSDIFLHSRLTDEDIAREQGVIGTEVRWNKDQPSRYIAYLLRQLSLPDQIVGTTILDEESRLKDKNHDSLVAFRARLYGKENFMAVVAGPIPESEARQVAETYYGTDEYASVDRVTFDSPVFRTEKAFHHEVRQVDQAHLGIWWEGFARDNDMSPACTILGLILGNKQNSRLGKILRLERNIVYETPRFENNSRHDHGFLGLYLRLKDESDLQESYETALAQILLIAEEGVTEAEVATAKAIHKSNFIFNREGMVEVVSDLATDHMWTDTPLSLEQQLARTQTVTAAQVQDAARHILGQEPKVVAISKNAGTLTI